VANGIEGPAARRGLDRETITITAGRYLARQPEDFAAAKLRWSTLEQTPCHVPVWIGEKVFDLATSRRANAF
jgi:hypothetical protein